MFKIAPQMNQCPMSGYDDVDFLLSIHDEIEGLCCSHMDHHTANHSDRVSISSSPDEGWGLLIEQGFSILESKYPKDLIEYLK